jgi:hypothetical protein
MQANNLKGLCSVDRRVNPSIRVINFFRTYSQNELPGGEGNSIITNLPHRSVDNTGTEKGVLLPEIKPKRASIRLSRRIYLYYSPRE